MSSKCSKSNKCNSTAGVCIYSKSVLLYFPYNLKSFMAMVVVI